MRHVRLIKSRGEKIAFRKEEKKEKGKRRERVKKYGGHNLEIPRLFITG